MFGLGDKERTQHRRKVNFYREFIHRDSLCFDIGAHKGNYTAVFSELGAKVISLEPLKKSFDHLVTRFSNNTRINCINKAVGNYCGPGELMVGNIDQVSTLSNEFRDAYSSYSYLAWNQLQDVEVTTIDLLVNDFGIPDFCKIDVEGWEKEVMNGCGIALPMLSFEYNIKLRGQAEDVVTLLSRKGHYRFNFVPYESCMFIFRDWKDADAMHHVIASLDKEILHGDIFARLRK